MKKNRFNLIFPALLILTALAIGQNTWAMQLFVQRMQTSQTYTFEVEPTDSHEALKAKIQEKLSIDPANQWLVYGDTKLEDGKTLSDYNIQAESTVKLYETSATSGFCGVATVNGGANVTWTYIESSNTLTIGGTGPMTNTFPGSNDPSVTPWGNYRSQIAHVVVEDGVTSIGKCSFYYIPTILSVSIGRGVKSIGNLAFYQCEGITEMIIPDNVNTLGNRVFYNCFNLATITGCAGITSIGYDAFFQTKWRNDQPSDQILYVGNVVLSANGVTGDVSNFRDGVVSFAERAFYGSRITSVSIPASITSISESAFYGCSKLTSVNIHSSVTNIGESAFEGCIALTSITIPASVTSIGNSAFWACTKLASVNLLGTTPPALGYSAFGVHTEETYTARVFNVRSADYLTASLWADIVNKVNDYEDHANFSMQVIYGLTLAGGATVGTAAIVSDTSASYYTEGTEVTLGHGTVPVGYSGFAGYAVTAGTLNGDVLTMPANDVTVTATWTESAELAITASAATLTGLERNWCTFYHPSLSYSLPNGAQAFTMKADKGLYLVGDGSEIPAGTPVVIMSDAAAITLTKLDASTMTAESDNIFQGTAAETLRTSLITGSQKVYVLGKVGDEFGFYEYTGDTIPANKAYYVE